MKFAVHLTAMLYRTFPADVVKESLNTMRPIMVEMGLDPELFYFVSLPHLHLYVATVTDAGLTESKKLCTIVRNIICDDPTFLMNEKEIMYDRKTFRLSNAWQSTIVQTARFIEMVLGGTVKYDLDIMRVYGEIFGDCSLQSDGQSRIDCAYFPWYNSNRIFHM